jgi:hypothetical protein
MPPALFEAIDCGDVRMIEGREHFRFALKPREPIGIVGERGRENLDRDLALEFRVGRPIHLPHPAFPDRRDDVVNAKARAGSQSQMCCQYRGRTGVRTRVSATDMDETSARAAPLRPGP